MKEISSLQQLLDVDCKHISFDLWLTLIKSNPEFKKKRNDLFKAYFEIDSSLERVSEQIRYYDLLCNNVNEKTGLNINTNEIYYLILSSLNCDISIISNDKLNEFYLKTEELFFDYQPIFLENNLVSTLKHLIGKDISLSIMSNTGFIKGETIRKFLQKNQLHELFSFQIYSDECNFSKPNEKIFDLAFNEVIQFKNVSKKEIVHVGDNIVADHHGAEKFGLSAILLKK